MRLCTIFIGVLVSLSSLLMPFANMHAHLFAPGFVSSSAPAMNDVGQGTASQLEFITRQGHVHPEHSFEEREEDSKALHPVIDFLVVLSDGVAKAWSMQLMYGLAVVFTLVLMFLRGAFLAAFLCPSYRPPAPSERRLHWRPPLRGPPALAVIRP